ncbi:CO or xanthine dehydrogenase, Mo-binding subunit [Marinitoga hydrogenitolerans DSM 16785]|uniref:CO or xanthine dehydrogenase, Mo-binding subunit n=1 Tax=Marinitoga hydrogenitolerans (strain DSM 16785 / JCM 12826 / AT1271) TaxID=1122195 RepID=A0A1M4T3F1_MARH1|nr:molybdopterin cofactor-binding domain-containing protein [Marinitoga hydrogenitolerans]SHE39062.1 CO or xanthine dehydrogenase, Mo-binding subunit [Marinitoga hydrogenitolerans DSM 16785]
MKEVKSSIKKVDGYGLVSGQPVYADDLAPKNALIVKILRSPYAFAKIKNIDTTEAEKLEGVECILTHKDVPKNRFTRAGQGYPEPSPYDKYILDEYVRYIGDEVAVVAARDEITAEKALKLLKVDYEVLEPVLDFEKSKGSKTIIHPEKDYKSESFVSSDPKNNIAATYEMSIGDIEKEIENSDVVVKERFYTQAQAHVMMEPHTAYSYMDMLGRLVVVSSTQVPFHVRRILSNALGMPIKNIRVIKPRVGGGFGGKQGIHGEPYVALVTLKTGKPAKVYYTRKEVFEATYTRHTMRFDVTIGADKNGKIKVIDVRGLSDTGAYGEHALTTFMVAGSKVLPMYNKVKAVRFGGDVVYTNHPSAGAYRGYGAIQANFAIESAMDILADKLGIDPVKLREINMIKENETSPIFKIMGEGKEGVDMVVRSCKLDECVTKGVQKINWEKKFKDKKEGKKVKGVGMAIAMQGSGIPKIDMASATLKLNDDGSFNLLIGATDIGTGSDTILSQIAADILNVPTEDVIPYSSDTDITPFDTGAYASSTTYVTGNAVIEAAKKMREEIIKAGAEYFEVSEDKVEFDGKEIKTEDRKISLKKLAEILYYNENQKQLSVTGSYVGEESPPPFMAGFAEVEVDTETGKVDLLNYVAVVDCGTPINPNLAKVQVEGGLAQGIGMAMYEEVKYDKNGRLLTNNLLNYKVPSRVDIKNLDVELVESYEPTGPFGAKSVGEIGIDTPPAAIANAVYNAVGVRIKELPITPEKVLMALRNKKNKI